MLSNVSAPLGQQSFCVDEFLSMPACSIKFTFQNGQ